MSEQKHKTETEKKPDYVRPQKPNALAYDRDKNLFYWANDESVDQILDSEGYHVVHANRDLKTESEKKKPKN